MVFEHGPPSAAVEGPRGYRRLLTLAALTLANTSNFWQRNLLYSLSSVSPPQCVDTCQGTPFVPLCESCEGQPDEAACEVCQQCRDENRADFYGIRDASCITDEAYGLLASIAFTAMFAVSGLVAGYVIDKYNSRLIHTTAIIIWSLSNLVKVFDPGFKLLVAMRLVMGVAQGFNAPCSYPVIAHNFRQSERASANGAYSTGTYLGSALATLSLAFAMSLGWRLTTVIASVCGFATAGFLLAVVPQRPPSKSSPTDIISSLLGSLRVIKRTPRLALLFTATSVRMMATVSLWTYLPTYYSRAFPHQESSFSVIYAFGTLICGASSSSLGGLVADRWAQRRPGAHALLPAIGTLLSVPFMAATLYVNSFTSSVVCLLFTIFFGECWLGPCMVLLYKDVPVSMLATQVSLLLVFNQLTASLGPWFISLADDGTTGIRAPFFAVTCTCCLLASFLLLFLGYVHDTKVVPQPPSNPNQREEESALLSKQHHYHHSSSRDLYFDDQPTIL